MKHIRYQINEFLELAGIPASKLAERAGVSNVLICRVRKGTRGDMASRYADAIRNAMLQIDYEAAKKALGD